MYYNTDTTEDTVRILIGILLAKIYSATMPKFTSISIIYNPNSTGSSKELALQLQEQLAAKLPDQKVDLVKTKYAGHGEKLAYQLAKSSKRPFVISSSGDGGYHEVINGLITAQQNGAHPVAGLLPAGNANDHYNHLHKSDTPDAIIRDAEKVIDILKVETVVNVKPFTRYAHSYIGIGLTPKAGRELNKVSLNPIKEIWLVVKVMFILRPVRIIIGKDVRSYYSLIFSNISKMSKVVSVSKTAKVNDGKFEITPFYDHGKARLLWKLLVFSTTGSAVSNHASEFSFHTIKPLLIQLDGEIYKIDASSNVKISILPKILHCII